MNNVIPLTKKAIRQIDASSEAKWVVRFAWHPVLTEDFGWVWLQKYQVLLEEGWFGGIEGGWTMLSKATVVFRSSILVIPERRYKKSTN